MQSINPEMEDVELVRLSLSEPECFSHIIGRYKDKLERYIRRLGAFNLEDAEDILQEVFLKVYKNLNGYDPQLKFSSWIYRIAHNEAISHYRRRKARPEGYSVPIDSPGLQLLASDLSLERQMDKVMRDKALATALLLIDERHRDILILKFFEEKSYNEISDIIKKPLGTVASLINRAKKDLKEALPPQWRES